MNQYDQAAPRALLGAVTGGHGFFEAMTTGLAYGLTSMIAMPIEMLVRPRFSTRYFPPLVLLAGWALLLIGAFLDFGLHISSSFGAPISMPVLYFAFYPLALYHSARLWPLVVHMEREKHSEQENEGWRIFDRLPKANYLTIRLFYEPAAVMLAAGVLLSLHILDPIAFLYVLAAGAALSIKNLVRLYDTWRILRDARDNVALNDFVGDFVAGKSVAYGRTILAGSSYTPETRRTIAKGLLPGFSEMVSPASPTSN